MLGFFFRHYDSWVDRYVIYDDGSTDGTLDVLRAHPRVEVRRFVRTDPSSFVQSHRSLQNSCWKESRGSAEWVVVTAVDEHLHTLGTPMREYLDRQRRRGVTYVPALGFEMISEELPQADERLAATRTTGAPYWQMNKLSVFDPLAISETRFAAGRHSARPRGRLRLPERDELLLLHYKHLGFHRVRERQALLRTGLGAEDLRRGHGVQYSYTLEQQRKAWQALASRAIDVTTFRSEGGTSDMARWWRAPVRYRLEALVRSLRRRLDGASRTMVAARS